VGLEVAEEPDGGPHVLGFDPLLPNVVRHAPADGQHEREARQVAAQLAPHAFETCGEARLQNLGTAGDGYEDQGLMFPSVRGTPMNAKNLTTRSFKPILKRAGLPNIRLHDLRHTCASLLLSRGVHPEFVQELLGHATISQRMDINSHAVVGMSDVAGEAKVSALS
jgi:integrase